MLVFGSSHIDSHAPLLHAPDTPIDFHENKQSFYN